MARASLLLALLVLAATLAPAAAAYHGQPGRAALVVEGPVDLEGRLEAWASPGAALWGPGGGFDATLHARSIEVERVEWREADGPVGALLEPEVRRERVSHADAQVTFHSAGEAFQLLVFQSGPSLVRAESDTGGRILPQVPGIVAPTPEAQRHGLERFGADAFSWGPERAGARLETAAPTVHAQGDFTLFLYDGAARVEEPGRVTQHRTGAGTDAGGDALTASSARWVAYALLHVRGAQMTVEPSAGFVALYGAHLETSLNGTARLPLARGSASVGDSQVIAEGPSAIEGVFLAAFSPARDAQALRMQASGDVAAFAVPGATHSYAPPVAQISLALVVLGILAWITKHGAVALYSRFAGPQVLRHEDRERALALVRDQPGITVQQLAQALRVSWSTASYHLAVLEREGMIVADKRGRHRRHTLAGSGHDRRALDVAAHPTARSLLDAIDASPGVSQSELAARVGITPSTASWHLKRLADAGLVRVRRVWRTAHYERG